MTRRRHRTRPAWATALVLLTVLAAACSSGEARQGPSAVASPPSHEAAKRSGLPSGHVHGVGRDPRTGALVLATHDGLFRYTGGKPERVGPLIDLMGFTTAGANHFYASGHPGAGTDLPQPLGLIESTDGGASWTMTSRGGESDFHALARAGKTIIGFDGQLRRTGNGRSWQTASIPAPPRTLASNPTGTQLLATTERGLLASNDPGATWAEVKSAPLLLLVAWADAQTVVGVTPDGAVEMSRDAVKAWRMTGRPEPVAQAMSASMTASGLEILIVTERGVLGSADGSSLADATT